METTRGAPDQPRPALGRRPWFAFERRARSLRRFAFAMTDARVPTRDRYGVLEVASTPKGRLLGIHGVQDGCAVLIRTGAVHGHWLRRPIGLIWLDASGMVIQSGLLFPRRTARCVGACYVLEVSTVRRLPNPGTQVVLLASSVRAGHPDDLRHPDRESR